MFNHFDNHFKDNNMEHPRVDNFLFKSLSIVDRGDLIKLFNMEKVKQVVWNYDSFKSPGLDGINFGFVKDF
jgi:hypothetical protein